MYMYVCRYMRIMLMWGVITWLQGKTYFGHLGQLALTNDHTRPVDNGVMGEAHNVHPLGRGRYQHIHMYVHICRN